MTTRESKKYDPEFMALLVKHGRINEETGDLRFEGMYASTFINFAHNGGIVSVPHSHVVWFLTHGRWPKEGHQIDHIDDDPMNNAPKNLQELTHTENQEKRRGRAISRMYGKTKYGHGITVSEDSRDKRWYARRYLSRGETKTGKTVNFMLFGADTESELDEKIKFYIDKGLDEKALKLTHQHYPVFIRRKSKYGHGISVSQRPDGTYRAKQYDRDTKRYTHLFSSKSKTNIEAWIFRLAQQLDEAEKK